MDEKLMRHETYLAHKKTAETVVEVAQAVARLEAKLDQLLARTDAPATAAAPRGRKATDPTA